MENKNFSILDKYFEEVIEPKFGINWGRSSYSQSILSSTFRGTIHLPSSFSAYKETDYYYKGKKEFIHFTSLSTFFKIIDNEYFLATQFTKHDDPTELIFAGNELLTVTNKKEINRLKELIFSLSMCIYEDKTDVFDMWRLYGDEGNGVGIVFSFYPNENRWNNSFLSSVYYGAKNENLNKFRNYSTAHNKFMQENPELEMASDNWGGLGIPDDVALFLAFHKNSIFQTENEVRFLKSFLNEKQFCDEKNDSIGIILGKENNIYNTYRIPIVSERNIRKKAQDNKKSYIKNFQNSFNTDIQIIEDYIKDEPFIIIDKVILGYRYKDEDLVSIRKFMSNIQRKLNAKVIEFELSHLCKNFYGI